MSPTERNLSSPAWVVVAARLIERLGVGGAVLTLVCATILGAQAIAYPLLLPQPAEWLPRGQWITLIVSAGISAPVSYVLCRLLADLSRSRATLQRIAHTDALTGAQSRRYFMETAPRLMACSECSSVVLLDLDDFKQINDQHGHLVGDAVLRAVSEACQQVLRGHGLFARHGGEEFVVLLPDVGGRATARLVARLRRAVNSLSLDGAGHAVTVTASFGVALRGRVADAEGALAQALEAADRALYEAKREGKDRIAFERGGPPLEERILSAAQISRATRSAQLPHPLGTQERRRARAGQPGTTFELVCWVALLARFVDRFGRLTATLVSVLISTVAAAVLTVVVMHVAGLVRFDAGIRFACLMTPPFAAAISWLLCSVVSDVSRARTLLGRIAHVDALTLVHSRRYFLEVARRRVRRAPTSAVVLFDIDRFKAINDRFGHGVGDDVLKAVSRAGAAALRDGDLFARYGGEEFVALLSGLELEAAYAIAERMRAAIAALDLRAADGTPLLVTASFGLSYAVADDGPSPPALEGILWAADRALYRAKRAGRNRIEVDVQIHDAPSSIVLLSPLAG